MQLRNPLMLILATLVFTFHAISAAAQSFFPAKDVAQFLLQNFDLSTFRNSLSPRRSKTQRTFSDLGIVPSQMRDNAVIMENNEWYYSLRILRRDDINGDGLEDLEVCFTDLAKQGTYSDQQTLLVTRYSASSYAVALKFEATGCEALQK